MLNLNLALKIFLFKNQPEKIFENEVAESWYKIDTEFKVPKMKVVVSLESPLNFGSSLK